MNAATTQQEADRMKTDRQITVWSKPGSIVNSAYGPITYKEWCQREQARFGGRGDKVRIIERRDGAIALTR